MSVGRDVLDQRATTMHRRPIQAGLPARLTARLARSLWMGDRGVAELRWGAVTLSTMALLAAAGKSLDPLETGFDAAVVLLTPAAALWVILGWTSWATRVTAIRGVRTLLGPLVVMLAMIATGPMDPATLDVPSAAPLTWLALAYAAVTPGFPLACSILAAGAAAMLALHHMVATPGGPNEGRDEYVVSAVVIFLATTGMYMVVRVATAAEARAMRLASRSRARVDALEALDRIDRRFDGSRPVSEIIQSVVEDVSREFDIALVSMYLPDEAGRMSMVGVAGYHSPFHIIELGVGVIGRAAERRATQFVPDVLVDPDYKAARYDVHSEVATPIVHDDELVGIINFEGTLEHPMTTAHVALAETLARSIAASLRAASLDQERRDRLHAIERVLDVSRGLVGDLDRTRTVRAVADAAADLLGAETVLIAGRDSKGRFIVEHETPSGTAGRILDATDGAAMAAIADEAPVVRLDDRPTLALPIRIEETVAAILVATRPAGAPTFGPVQLRIADLLATQVAVALRNADRHARVSDAALRDPLTGLLNRRSFDEAVEAAFATARRTGTALSLIVLDLDRFSAVNNEYGHAAGDAVLRRVARAMSAAVRAGDTVARYGGEEFVVIAPGADTAEAVAVAERIRGLVAVTASDEAAGVTMTVSAGVASLLGDELDGRALFRAADSALLAAKRAGRDRVVAV